MIDFSCYLLLGELDKVLKTFIPNYDIPGYASSLTTVSVIFSKIIIEITERKISVHCNITQPYDLVRNFIDGNGVTIIAATDMPTSPPQGRQEWEITGTGTIAVLQQLVWLCFVNMVYFAEIRKCRRCAIRKCSVFLKQHRTVIQNYVHSIVTCIYLL